MQFATQADVRTRELNFLGNQSNTSSLIGPSTVYQTTSKESVRSVLKPSVRIYVSPEKLNQPHERRMSAVIRFFHFLPAARSRISTISIFLRVAGTDRLGNARAPRLTLKSGRSGSRFPRPSHSVSLERVKRARGSPLISALFIRPARPAG